MALAVLVGVLLRMPLRNRVVVADMVQFRAKVPTTSQQEIRTYLMLK